MSQPAGKKWTAERVAHIARWCAAVVAVAGLLWSVSTAWFILRADFAEGVVLQWDAVRSRGRDSNGMSTSHTTWYAEVQFTDAAGIRHRTRSPRGHNTRLWAVGQTVPIHYNPANPEDILISHNPSIWFPPACILGLGTFLFLLSSLALGILRRAARRNAQEVAEIVEKYISKKKPSEPEPASPPAALMPQPVSIPGTSLRYVALAPPPGETFTNVGYLDSTDLVPALGEEFKKLDPAVLLLLAANEEHLILHSRDRARRFPRAEIRELSVYPVLPAKASGHVQMHVELGPPPTKLSRNYVEYFMCGPYSESLQNWCLDKTRQAASMLDVPVTLEEPGHDC